MTRAWNPDEPTKRAAIVAVLDQTGLAGAELLEATPIGIRQVDNATSNDGRRPDRGMGNGYYYIIVDASDASDAIDTLDRIRPIAANHNLYPIITAERDGIWLPHFADDPAANLDASESMKALDDAAAHCDPRWRLDEKETSGPLIERDWPNQIPYSRESYEIRDARLTSDPPRVALRFLPGRDAISAVSHIDYRGDSPPTPRILANLRRWNERYGLDLISASNCSIEIRVGRFPADRTEALKTARECYLLCPSIGGEYDDILGFECDDIHKLAAHLMGSAYWLFWWS